MIQVGILGATGYTALELLKLLLRHPEVEITTLTSRQEGRPHLATIHPELTGRLDLHLDDLAPQAIAAKVDCVFSCLPHAASAALVKQVLAAGSRVIDFSADYRLQDLETYLKWYGDEHPDPERIGHIPYGLPELFADQICSADLVANPGCNPTAPILGLAPLLKQGLIEPHDIIVDAKCGVSGAGRTPKMATLFPECNESVTPYGVGQHRHTPEFNQILTQFTQQAVDVLFTPHLVPMSRGILTTTYVLPQGTREVSELMSSLRDFYADCPFVRIVDHLPSTKHTLETNFCDLTVRQVRNRFAILGSIDNLGKGASGAAVQNFNLMFGFDETTAL